MAQTMIKRGDQNTAQELIEIGDHHHYDFHTKSHLRRAIQYYNRALAQQPTAIAYAKLATVRMKLRKFSRALFDANVALGMDSKCVKAHIIKAFVFTERRQLTDAIMEWIECLELKPNNPWFLMQLDKALEMSLERSQWQTNNSTALKYDTYEETEQDDELQSDYEIDSDEYFDVDEEKFLLTFNRQRKVQSRKKTW